jgi:hypothetical protein
MYLYILFQCVCPCRRRRRIVVIQSIAWLQPNNPSSAQWRVLPLNPPSNKQLMRHLFINGTARQPCWCQCKESRTACLYRTDASTCVRLLIGVNPSKLPGQPFSTTLHSSSPKATRQTELETSEVITRTYYLEK